MNLFSKKIVTAFSTAIIVAGASIVSAQQEQLYNLMKITPPDHDVYFVLNAGEMSTIASEKEGFASLMEEMKGIILEENEEEASAAEKDMADYFMSKVGSKGLGWVIMSVDLPDDPNVDQPDEISMRMFGNLPGLEIQERLAPHNIAINSPEDVVMLADETYMRVYTDGYVGVDSKAETLGSTQGIAAGPAATHLGNIANSPIMASIVFSAEPMSSSMGQGMPPFVGGMDAVSLSGIWQKEGMLVNMLGQFNDEQAFNEGFAFLNQYWQMAPMMVEQQKQMITSQMPEGDPERAEAMKGIETIQQALQNASLTQNPPNIVLSIPVRMTKDELGDYFIQMLQAGVSQRNAIQQSAPGGPATAPMQPAQPSNSMPPEAP